LRLTTVWVEIEIAEEGAIGMKTENLMKNTNLWEEVQENNRKKEACPLHTFKPMTGAIRIGQKFTCTNCGGERFSLVDIGHYLRGYKAAGGDPDDVFPGWANKIQQPTTSDE
jgi:hypothetical protein